MRLAKRLAAFDAYLGTEMNVRLTRMREEGRDVINLGLGDPDVIPPPHLIRALQEGVSSPDHHHYPSFYSNRPLKEAHRWLVPPALRCGAGPGDGGPSAPRVERGPLRHPPEPPRSGDTAPGSGFRA